MINWSYNQSDQNGPASAEVGALCLWVSRVGDCPDRRWVWTGDLLTEHGEGIRMPPPLMGIASSRTEAMNQAKIAVQLWLVSKPTVVKNKRN